MSTSDSYDYLVKLLIIGNSSVGKTCLIQRFYSGDFSVNYLPTIAIDFKMKIFEVDGLLLKMQIWDTAGQERFNTLTANFFKAAHGVVVVYSVTDEASFAAVGKWVAQIQNCAPKNVQVLLVGNKTDLTAERVISYQQGEECAAKFGAAFAEVSAFNGSNVEEAFAKMGRQVSREMNLSKSQFPSLPSLQKPAERKCCAD